MDSSHVLTTFIRSRVVNYFLKKVIGIPKYGFQTLESTKFEIFSDLVKCVWKVPRQHLLIGNVFEILLFDVWKGLDMVFVDLRHLFFGQLLFFIYIYIGDFEIF